MGPARELAAAHPDGIVDLSVGTPVDPTPTVVQEALRQAADAPGYPADHSSGRPPRGDRRVAAPSSNRCWAIDPNAILPVIGTKEMVAWLPTLLGARSLVGLPELAYPTYEVGACACRCPARAQRFHRGVGSEHPAGTVAETPRLTPRGQCCLWSTCAKWCGGRAVEM